MKATEDVTGIATIKLLQTGETISGGGSKTTVTKNFTVTENGTYTIEVTTVGGRKTTSKITVTSILEQVNPGVILAATKEYTDDQGANAWVPKGFKIVSDGSTGNKSRVSEGLVIEDIDGNQFVWIPCTVLQLNEPAWQEWIDYAYAVNGSNGLEPENLTVVGNSISSYGGFYLGRYEAGYSEGTSVVPEGNAAGIPLSKKNATVWNNIGQPTAMARSSAMYSGSDSVVSHLMYAAEMRRVLRWFVETGSLNWSQINNNSTSWGNYQSSQITGVTKYHEYNASMYSSSYTISSGTTKTSGTAWRFATGNTDYTKVNNIYDLAGNILEWTQEWTVPQWGSSLPLWRGGDSDAAGYPVIWSYNGGGADYVGDCVGFRVALYIKL